MKRILASVACLSLAAIYAATLLLGADQKTGISDEDNPCTYTLSKHEFGGASRTSFTLDVKPKRADVAVTALCELEDEQQAIGKFWLGNLNSNVDDAPVRFFIGCLANTCIDKSTIRVVIREEKTTEYVGSFKISLRDAVPEASSTSAKNGR